MLKKREEHNINEWLVFAKSLVGTTRELNFNSQARYFDEAGEYEILSFKEYEKPQFTFNFYKYEEEDTPSNLHLGVYEIKIKNTKKYNNKTFHFPVSAYFSDYNGKYNEYLSISEKRIEDNRYLQAYRFKFIER
jgi:hypothetical protein